MSPVIRISDETFEKLQLLAKPFVDTPERVIRRLLDATAGAHSNGSGQAAQVGESFFFTVHKTYFDQGFFNVTVDDADKFGDDGESIELFCANANQPLIGTINRTANVNGTPRIMGRKGLRDWFQRELSKLDEVKVTVLSPTAIRLERKR